MSAPTQELHDHRDVHELEHAPHRSRAQPFLRSPRLRMGLGQYKNAMLGWAKHSYGVSLLSWAYTILTPLIILSTTTPSTSTLGLDTNRESELTSLILHFTDKGEDDRKGNGENHSLRMHTSNLMLVHLHSSASKKKVA
ncbi:hypothetical protein CVT25_015770 [Psilocybe cyanescens]|uniref:Uncharacterized protein n=1 Tax=Psilocybe cyanescens TaxID=93625 RepID=A0A409X1D8_PSICY|nr:hypothetical protein CVT25_015770 [Psilocybe cyanescens]